VRKQGSIHPINDGRNLKKSDKQSSKVTSDQDDEVEIIDHLSQQLRITPLIAARSDFMMVDCETDIEIIIISSLI